MDFEHHRAVALPDHTRRIEDRNAERNEVAFNVVTDVRGTLKSALERWITQ